MTGEPATTPSGRRTAAHSTAFVGVGLLVFGLSGFGYLAVAGRDLGPTHVAPVAVAWSTINALALGLYAGVEQHVARRIGAARMGGPPLQIRREILPYLVGSVVVLSALAAAAAPFVVDRLLGGSALLLAWIVLAFATHAIAYLARGVLAGRGHFARYGAQLALDGALRVLGTVAVALSPRGDAAAYVLVVAVSPLVATVLTTPWGWFGGLRERAPAAPAAGVSGAEVPSGGRLRLVVGLTLTSQLVANLGLLAIALKAADQPAVVSAFSYATTVGRLPFLLYAAVQAVALPALAAQAATGARAGFVRTLRRFTALTGALAVGGVLGVAALGARVIGWFYGPEFAVGEPILLAITGSGALFMVAGLAGQALLAVHADRVALLGWVLGLVVHGLALLPTGDPSTVVAVSMLIGSLVAGGGLAILLWRALSRVLPERPQPEAVS